MPTMQFVFHISLEGLADTRIEKRAVNITKEETIGKLERSTGK